MMCRFPVAASRGKTAGGHESGQQAARKHAAGLQSRQTENLPWILRISMPIHKDVENLRSENSGEDDRNPEIPRVLRLYSLLHGIAHTDPNPDQYAERDQHSIGGYAEIAEM